MGSGAREVGVQGFRIFFASVLSGVKKTYGQYGFGGLTLSVRCMFRCSNSTLTSFRKSIWLVPYFGFFGFPG